MQLIIWIMSSFFVFPLCLHIQGAIVFNMCLFATALFLPSFVGGLVPLSLFQVLYIFIDSLFMCITIFTLYLCLAWCVCVFSSLYAALLQNVYLACLLSPFSPFFSLCFDNLYLPFRVYLALSFFSFLRSIFCCFLCVSFVYLPI